MKQFKDLQGIKGEEAAASYLRKKGYQILQRNFKARYGEIDIIAIDKDVLVFVEVKTRSTNEFGSPLESITPWKLRSVIKTAEFYKLMNPKLPDGMRIDAVSVTVLPTGDIGEIDHIENISG